MSITRNKITLRLIRLLNKMLLLSKEESRNAEKYFKSKAIYNHLQVPDKCFKCNSRYLK